MLLSIVVILSGSTISAIAVQPLKTSLLSSVSESGIFTLASDEQYSNKERGNTEIPSGMAIDTSFLQL